MRIRETHRRSARRIWLACCRDGEPQPAAVRAAVTSLADHPERGGSAVLAALVERLRRYDRQHRALVESAEPLDAAAQQAVRDALAVRLGSAGTVEFAVVPGLIAGMRIQVGHTVVDGSVHGRLERLRQALQGE